MHSWDLNIYISQKLGIDFCLTQLINFSILSVFERKKYNCKGKRSYKFLLGLVTTLNLGFGALNQFQLFQNTFDLIYTGLC